MRTRQKCIVTPGEPIFDLDGVPVKYNATAQIRGSTRDEQLAFDDHVKSGTRKASNFLRIICEVTGIASLSTNKLIYLYISLLHSIMEYGTIIYSTANIIVA